MIYDTGVDVWEHGRRTPALNGHKLLGPCPACGKRTFDYGGGWRCVALYCENSANNPAPSVGKTPSWWGTGIQVRKDGDQWCAIQSDYINLQESPAGFGRTPQEAVNELEKVQS